jgi:two-component system chemotaxis response regulator CheB
VGKLMDSAAEHCGKNAIGIMLTGMGADGAIALKRMREAGARTMAQDEESCVVFGMPKAAWEKGGVEKLHPLSKIADATINILKRNE